MGFFDQKRTAAGQLFPSPREGERICETPPCISWLSSPSYVRYRVVLRRASDEELIWSGETDKNYIVPDIVVPPGEYTRVITAYTSAGDGDISAVVSFSIAPDAVVFIRPSAAQLLAALPDEHPRLLFRKCDIPALCRTHPAQLEVLRRNIALALSDGMPEPPRFHIDRDALAYREYFGRYRDFCDRDLVACSLGWQLLGDKAAGEHAKALLMNICSWNPNGPCSILGGWGDEVGLSNARVLSAAYDMLYDLLNSAERDFVRHTVFEYARQCRTMLRRIDFTRNPGNSHAGRIPAYMGQAALVLWGECGDDIPEHELIAFTEDALGIYGGVFPYFGTPDGGWAEGPFYASSYTKWYLPYFLAVERYTGKSFLSRPFYRNVCSFFERFARPDCENHPFGDGYWCRPDDAEWPGFFAQNPFRVYAERYGSARAKKYLCECDKVDIYKLHLLDIFVPEIESKTNVCSDDFGAEAANGVSYANICLHGKSESEKNTDTVPNICSDHVIENSDYSGGCTNISSPIGYFPEAGFVSLEAGELMLLARASKFGTFSHMHPDNGSFALFCHGTALISPSGYFGRAYGSVHHRLWTNSSRAHNTVLCDGEGQQSKSYAATGKIVCARRLPGEDEAFETTLDLADAYPAFSRFLRTITLTRDALTVHDEIISESEHELSWLLHTLSRPFYGEDGTTVERGGVRLLITPARGLLSEPDISDRFAVDINEGVEERYKVEMKPQYHITYKAQKARRHDIEVRFKITQDQ